MLVLIADDDKRVREQLLKIVNDASLVAVTASTGSEAVESAMRLRPSVLILDGLMPRMHGLEVSRLIRSLDPSYRPGIILMSAIYRGTRYENEAKLRFGVDAYLEKPVRADQVRNAISRVTPQFQSVTLQTAVA